MKRESIFFGCSRWLPILCLISLSFMIQNYSITTHLSMCAWPFLKAKEVLFSLFNYNFYTVNYTDIKHAIQWALTNTFMQPTFRSRSRTFPALQKVPLWPFHSILESLSLLEKEEICLGMPVNIMYCQINFKLLLASFFFHFISLKNFLYNKFDNIHLVLLVGIIRRYSPRFYDPAITCPA